MTMRKSKKMKRELSLDCFKGNCGVSIGRDLTVLIFVFNQIEMKQNKTRPNKHKQ